MIEFRSLGWSGSASSWPLDRRQPVLVLLHGAGFSARLWHNLLANPPAGCQLLALDLPGHGESSLPTCASIDEFAQSVQAFLDHHELTSVILCGHSMGGAISLRMMLARAPSWLQGAVLVSTGARLRVLPQILETVRLNYAAYLAHFVEFAAGPASDKAAIGEEVQAMATLKGDVAYTDFKACDNFDLIGKLDAIQLPVLLVHGEADQVTPIKYGEYLANELPQARLVRAQGCGHLLPLEQPELLAAAIEGFLQT